MASVEISGMGETILSMEQVAELSGTGVLDEMLEAEAEIVAKQQQSTARSMGVVDTGETARSVTSSSPKEGEDGRECYVYFSGSRTRFGTTTRNSEIAFINEYGKTGQAARPFVQTANAKAESRAVQAAEDVYDSYLRSQGLI